VCVCARVRVCKGKGEREERERERERERENNNITKYDLLTFCTFGIYAGRRKDVCPEKFVSVGSAGSADVDVDGRADDVDADDSAGDSANVDAGDRAEDIDADAGAGGCVTASSLLPVNKDFILEKRLQRTM